MLGTYLTEYLKDKYTVVPLTRKHLDLTEDEDNIWKFLKANVNKDDIIINSAGMIPQRSPQIIDMIKVNSIFPNILARFKKEVGCEVIHITTDCVFNGRGEGEYLEDEPHNCEDVYGKSKSLGENDTLTMIRTSIIGEEKNNKKSLLEWVRGHEKGDEIFGYGDHFWNGITCLELSKIIDKIIKSKNFWNGVRHIHSPSFVSKYVIVRMINDIYKLGLEVRLKRTKTCDRTLSSISADIKVEKEIREQIKELKEFKIDE